MRRSIVGVAVAAFLFAPAASSGASDAQEKQCVVCHTIKTPGVVRQWEGSTHGELGISCVACHTAQPDDADAFEHNGVVIATLVTPTDCAQCHAEVAEEVGRSHHATAGKILESNDAYLAHAAGGLPVAIAGCEACHGTRMEIDPDSPNKLSARTWPNSGIGRINPDGSLGACTACHTGHAFDRAQARKPQACGKCHLGPDHPQKEIYASSKHGQVYFSRTGEMNLDSKEWVVGKDYWAAPTCSTCHMSATTEMPVTHDVGERISWNLRPPISKRMKNWEQKRGRMKQVCAACHGVGTVTGFYNTFDGIVTLYDEKFAKPAAELMKMLQDRDLLPNKAAFSNQIEWDYWELWHHEGRRARHGASMMSPDYTWWDGIYEVAHRFYFELIPQVRELGDDVVNARVDEILAQPMHAWMQQSTPDIKKAIQDGSHTAIYEHMLER